MKNGTGLAAGMIGSALPAYATGAVDRLATIRPELTHGGNGTFRELKGDCEIRLRHLAQALRVGDSRLFHDYLAWNKVTFASRGVDPELVKDALVAIREELTERLPDTVTDDVRLYLDAAIVHVDSIGTDVASHIRDDDPHAGDIRELLLAMLEDRRGDALTHLRGLRAGGLRAAELHDRIIAPAMAEVGRLWQVGQAHVGEEHVSSRLIEIAIAVLTAETPEPPDDAPRALLTCVEGELHDMGARMANHVLLDAGWRCRLAGASLPDDDVVHLARDFDPALVAISVQFPLNIEPCRRLVGALRAAASGARIVVGGAPFVVAPALSEFVGADDRAANMTELVDVARRVGGSA